MHTRTHAHTHTNTHTRCQVVRLQLTFPLISTALMAVCLHINHTHTHTRTNTHIHTHTARTHTCKSTSKKAYKIVLAEALGIAFGLMSFRDEVLDRFEVNQTEKKEVSDKCVSSAEEWACVCICASVFLSFCD